MVRTSVLPENLGPALLVSVTAGPYSDRGCRRRILPCSRRGTGVLMRKARHHDMCGRPLPPIIFPGGPERWWGDEALKAEADAPQATLEQRHQAAGDVLALRCRGFFSAGALFFVASPTPGATPH